MVDETLRSKHSSRMSDGCNTGNITQLSVNLNGSMMRCKLVCRVARHLQHVNGFSEFILNVGVLRNRRKDPVKDIAMCGFDVSPIPY